MCLLREPQGWIVGGPLPLCPITVGARSNGSALSMAGIATAVEGAGEGQGQQRFSEVGTGVGANRRDALHALACVASSPHLPHWHCLLEAFPPPLLHTAPFLELLSPPLQGSQLLV